MTPGPTRTATPTPKTDVFERVYIGDPPPDNPYIDMDIRTGYDVPCSAPECYSTLGGYFTNDWRALMTETPNLPFEKMCTVEGYQLTFQTDIPAYAEIVSATVTVYISETQGILTVGDWWFQQNNVVWTNVGTGWQTSPDLKNYIQEQVNQMQLDQSYNEVTRVFTQIGVSIAGDVGRGAKGCTREAGYSPVLRVTWRPRQIPTATPTADPSAPTSIPTNTPTRHPALSTFTPTPTPTNTPTVPQIMPNPGFESTYLNQWDTCYLIGNCGLTNREAHTGYGSYYLYKGYYAPFSVYQPLDVVGNTTYTFSFWHKGSPVDCIIRDSTWQGIITSVQVAAANDWMQETLTVSNPSGNTQVFVVFESSEATPVYLDDLAFSPPAGSTPTPVPTPTNTATPTNTPTPTNTATPTLVAGSSTLQVSGVARDGYDDGTNVYQLDYRVKLGQAITDQTALFMFNASSAPPVPVKTANLQVYVTQTVGLGWSVDIYGQAADKCVNLTPPNEKPSDSARVKTSTHVTWNMPSGTGWKTSPDISPVRQEIFDRAGYNSQLCLILVDNQSKQNVFQSVWAYDAGSTYAAKLTYSWSNQ